MINEDFDGTLPRKQFKRMLLLWFVAQNASHSQTSMLKHSAHVNPTNCSQTVVCPCQIHCTFHQTQISKCIHLTTNTFWFGSLDIPRMFKVEISSRKLQEHVGVSKNGGSTKSSILVGCSLINPPFLGTPSFGNPHMINQVNQSISQMCWPLPQAVPPLRRIKVHQKSIAYTCWQGTLGLHLDFAEKKYCP